MDIPVELFMGFIGVSIALAIFGFIRNPQIPAMLVFAGMFMLVIAVSTDNIQFGYSDAVLVNQTTTNFNNTDNYAIVFNGFDQYLQSPNNTGMDIGTEDFAFWLELTRLNDTGGFENIFQKRDLSAPTNAGYAFYINNADNLVFEISDGSAVTTLTSTFAINVNIDYMIGVSTNRQAELLDIYYYNKETGVLLDSQFGIAGQSGSLSNTQTFTIGKRSDANSQFANRYMDNFAFLDNNFVTSDEFQNLIDGIGIVPTNYYTFELNTNDVVDGIDLIPFNDMTFVLLEIEDSGTIEQSVFTESTPNLFAFTELPKVLFSLIAVIFMLVGALMVIKTQ